MPTDHDKRPVCFDGDFGYHSYLLRFWQEDIDEAGVEPVWRVTLEHFDYQQTRKQLSSLDELIAYLSDELGSATDVTAISKKSGKQLINDSGRR